jgi:hypothetical protein
MRGFLLIFAAGMGSAFLGGALGWFIGILSPEFIQLVAGPFPVANPGELGAALGIVSGLLMGAMAMAFGLVIGVFRGRGRNEDHEVTAFGGHRGRLRGTEITEI